MFVHFSLATAASTDIELSVFTAALGIDDPDVFTALNVVLEPAALNAIPAVPTAAPPASSTRLVGASLGHTKGRVERE